MVEQGYRSAVRGYLEARPRGGRRPALRVAAEALVSGEPAAAALAATEPLASYLVLACAVPDPAQLSAGQLDAIEECLGGIPGALYCGDLSCLVVLLPAGAPPALETRPETVPETLAAGLPGRLRSLSGQLACAAQSRRSDLGGIP